MPIEIACPGCRFLLRADDEFAGESAPCPYCGATIAVPNPRPTGITDTMAYQGPPSDEGVGRDSREGNSFSLRRRLPIPPHGELRPVDALEPDEDRPLIGPALPTPPGPRTLAVMAFLSAIFSWLVYWGVAIWHFEEQPIQATVVGLCGCSLLFWGVMTLHSMWPKGPPTDDEDEEPSEARSIEKVKVTFWSSLWPVFQTVLAIYIIYTAYHGTIIVLAIPLGWDLLLCLVLRPRYRQLFNLRSSLDVSRVLLPRRRDDQE